MALRRLVISSPLLGNQMFKHLLLLLSLAVPAVAQTTYHYPALETSNVFVGANTYNGATTFNGITTFNVLPSAGSDLPSGHQFASANAAVTAYNVTAFGAVPDVNSADFSQGFALTAGSNVLTASGAGFTSSNIISANGTHKWVCLNNNYSAWSAVPWSGGGPYCAQIASFVDSNHVVLSVVAANVNTTSGLMRWGTDSSPGFNACAAKVTSNYTVFGFNGGTCKIPSAGTNTYLLATNPYYVLVTGVDGGVDDGSYGTPAGGTGGILNCPVTGGALSSCTVTSAGSGYPINSTMQTSATTAACQTGSPPCGFWWVTAQSDGSGHITSASIVYSGFGITASSIYFNVTALGGDGITATVSLSGGATGTPVLGAAGSGYGGATSIDYWLINSTSGASGCAITQTTLGDSIQIVGKGTATLSGGSATGAFTVTTGATGCTTPPTVVFSDYFCNSGTLGSPVWGQCTNLAPLSPVKIPVSVLVPAGVSFIGEQGGSLSGTALVGNWDKISFDSGESAMFGGIFTHADIGGFNIVSENLIGLLSISYVSYAQIHDMDFGSGIGIYMIASDTQSRYRDLSFSGLESWINGGVWAHRIDFPTGQGGEFDADSIYDLVVRLAAYGGAGSVEQKLDDWFANNFWHPEYSGASPDWPSGEVCKFPQTVNQRQTSRNIPLASIGYTANTMCYRGASSIALAIYARDDRSSGNANISNMRVKQVSRYGFLGSLGGMQISNLGCEGCVPITGNNDPYRSATTQEGWVVYTGGSSSAQLPVINGINFSGTTNITQALWEIGVPNGLPLTGTYWMNLAAGSYVNSMAVSNPNFLDNINFSYGLTLSVASNTGQSSPISVITNVGGGVDDLTGQIGGVYQGLYFKCGLITLSDCFDVLGTGLVSHVSLAVPYVIPIILYSAAGTSLPTCTSGLKGTDATVSDATAPTYMGAYTSGGTVTAHVICNGTGSWFTH
jgi:hypothetical protein